MAFFQRVFSYVFNELLVDTLANSRNFQRFAIRTNEMLKEASKKGAEKSDIASEKVGDFQRVFREELKKGFEDLNKKK